MTRAGRIRDAIRDAGRPLTAGEIAAVVPGHRTHHAIGAMIRDGQLLREGTRGSYLYYVNANRVGRIKLAPEERRKRRNERERIRGERLRRAAGAMTLAELQASRKLAAEQKAIRKAEEKAARKAEREAAREAARLARESMPKVRKPKKPAKPKAPSPRKRKVNVAYNCAIEPARTLIDKAPQRVVVPETVEQWMARTGKKPEVLPGVGAALRDAA